MSGHRPSLDVRLVEGALAAMSGTKPLGNHPLKFFLSVTNRLRAPHTLTGDLPLEAAVFDHLIATITDHYTALRQEYGLRSASCRAYAANLAEDFTHGNQELEGWSVLYHRYACIDQNLSMRMIEDAAQQEARTVRRRQKLALERLTLDLIRLEQNARFTEHQQRLRLALPRLELPLLFGRAALFSQAIKVLRSGLSPHHLLLHGAPGIGKTVLAMAVVQELLNELDDVLWINLDTEPLAFPDLDADLIARLSLPVSSTATARQSLRAYLSAYSVLVVLDHAESLLVDYAQTEQVLAALEPARIVVTSQTRARLPIHVYELSLPPLERHDAFHLVEQIAISAPTRRDPLDRFDAIWATAGGNPLALQVLAQQSWAVPVSGRSLSFELDDIYGRHWGDLTPVARRLWLLPLLFPPSGMPYDAAAHLAAVDAETADRGLQQLVNATLLHATPNGDSVDYTLRDLAALYVREQVNRDVLITEREPAQAFIRRALNQQVERLQIQPDPATALLTIDLSARFLLPVEQRCSCAYALAAQITNDGRWYAWSRAIQSLLSDAPDDYRPWLNAQHGVAQRWLGDLSAAWDSLQRALATYPEDSAEQADVLIELAVVNRYWGRWEAAQDDLLRALRLYSGANEAVRAERCIQELCQLMIDGQQPDEALRWLSRLSPSARMWSLASQIYLQTEDYRGARHAAEQALHLLPTTHANRGRALATLGQIHVHLGALQQAVQYLTLAADLLEQAHDIVGLARAHNNLAAAYLHQPLHERRVSPQEIFDLLHRAWTIQQHMGDAIGLEITRQNFAQLHADSGLDPPY
ncbi:NB-ARC domain-containing protein [Aggregatilinea lenta]|uniref:NB-ARC domain-containing protein n=1 Tax=Aggregatilinea lenta TaxID=913108 RepID=UPI000E5C28B7|nr:NB-ARC domain-containing protein [Aggregatilinea lenta]